MSNQVEKKKFNFGQFYGKYGIALIFVVIFIAASLFVPGFLSTYNLKSILLAIACTTVLGFGATFIIILGHINIAYGSEIAFIGCIACMVDVATGSVWAAIAVALVIGVLLGALTGFIITKFSIPAFIMTLALTEAARGGAVLSPRATPSRAFRAALPSWVRAMSARSRWLLSSCCSASQ